MFASRNFLFTKSVAGGGYNPLLEGQLWSWGRNNQGELGLGNQVAYSSPMQVGSLATWKYIGSGMAYSASQVIKSDNTMWTWGSNVTGALGQGNPSGRVTSPVQVGSTTWASPVSGFGFTGRNGAAVRTNGTLWTWGSNANGELGLNNTTNYSSPVQVGALFTWASVTKGSYHMLAVKTDGTLWAWGKQPYFGQLGLGNTTNYSSPKQVGADVNWAKVSAGYSSSLAIKTDGTLWAWGSNANGQLGLGNTTAYSSPKQVGSSIDWFSVSAGNRFTLAIKTDGTLWAWGGNAKGQLGLGDTTNRSSPVKVGTAKWNKVIAGSFSTIATSSGGSLWAWGNNNFGQLGLGNTTDYSAPKQIGALTTWQDVSNAQYFTLAVKTA
jgi:alpha-tubulin suppressor-like RCC1 family protein